MPDRPRCSSRSRWLMLVAVSIVGLLFSAAGAGASVYTWTDANGVRHYSDQAGDRGARPADLSVRALPSPPAPEPSSGPASNGLSLDRNDGGPRTPTSATHEPRILEPAANAIIDNAARQAMVSIALGDGDGLADDETLAYRLDGRALDDAPARATRLVVDRLAPGRHRLEVSLLVHGEDTGRTDAVNFVVAPAGQTAQAPSDGRPPY